MVRMEGTTFSVIPAKGGTHGPDAMRENQLRASIPEHSAAPVVLADAGTHACPVLDTGARTPSGTSNP